MQKVALFLTCLACVGHGRRVHSPAERWRSSAADSSRALANVFLAHHPAAAFNPSGLRLSPNMRTRPVSHAKPSNSHSRLGHRAPLMSADLVDLGSIMQLADASRITEEAMKVANGQSSWFENYVNFVENGIFGLYDALTGIGLPGAYGVTILSFVLLAKSLALPLNWKQYSSSSQMKAMKPQQDLIRKWYGDNKDMMNIQVGVLFDRFDANPLAGCLPSLAQIPIFLGVYYSVTSIAKAKIINDGFLWIPSLSGPVASRTEGLKWLTENWIDGHPALGWETTLAYLSIPAILFCTQTAALYLLGTLDALENSDDGSGATKSTGLILKALPLLLAYFAMQAPAGLGLYWIFNNILTTAQTSVLKRLTEQETIKFDVDIATLGPRRDPQPLPSTRAVPDFAEVGRAKAEAKAAAAKAAEEAKGGAAPGTDGALPA